MLLFSLNIKPYSDNQPTPDDQTHTNPHNPPPNQRSRH